MDRKVIVYQFGEGNPESDDAKQYLGGKGHGLGLMTNIGLPVPSGFTIPTTMCQLYMEAGRKWPAGLEEEVERNLALLEKKMGKILGNPEDPLLVSVRSGAAISMPGMMDTVLNLGLNDKSVAGLGAKTGNERFAYDSYRRLMQMFGNVVMKIERVHFEDAIEAKKKERGIKSDVELTTEDLKAICDTFRKIYQTQVKRDFPQDVKEQLRLGISAVFDSWNNHEAIAYRRINKLEGVIGSAVNVQAMVFGNKGDTSGTGVGFTRDPATGEPTPFGEFLPNAQGEDVVAGIRTPIKIAEMQKMGGIWPRIYEELMAVMKTLESHYKDMVDLEYTIEEGKLWMLQSRSGKRTGMAMIRIACDQVDEGVIDEKQALLRMEAGKLNECLFPRFNTAALPKSLGRAIGASPGAAVGPIVFTPEDAVVHAAKKPILVRAETTPEDIEGMNVAAGILTQKGGATSHAAVVARGMGKCCVCGFGEMHIALEKKKLMIGDQTFGEGDFLSIDGTTGTIYPGEVPRVPAELDKYFHRVMEWSDKYRMLGIRTNADTPQDATRARQYGAQGIGLTRTEHMFFDEKRIFVMRKMILAESKEERQRAMDEMIDFQRSDFYGIFKAMTGLPVTIRLLDPPLHEFLPTKAEQIRELAEAMGKTFEQVDLVVHSMLESNPMLGFRGCRLGVVYPEITAMQVRAVMEAAVQCAKDGFEAVPEIMVPLVFGEIEFNILQKVIQDQANEVLAKSGLEKPIELRIGTMIELPRACIKAAKIAETAEFFSFGTNDLTQTTLGLSRDDSSKFLPMYMERGVFKVDPFETLDQEGVGWLMNKAVVDGRSSRPDLKIGICGEQTDPGSIQFLHDLGLTYVSCSPFRVPVARLSAARAALLSKVRKVE